MSDSIAFPVLIDNNDNNVFHIIFEKNGGKQVVNVWDVFGKTKIDLEKSVCAFKANHDFIQTIFDSDYLTKTVVKIIENRTELLANFISQKFIQEKEEQSLKKESELEHAKICKPSEYL